MYEFVLLDVIVGGNVGDFVGSFVGLGVGALVGVLLGVLVGVLLGVFVGGGPKTRFPPKDITTQAHLNSSPVFLIFTWSWPEIDFEASKT